jgi:hypothetical protein
LIEERLVVCFDASWKYALPTGDPINQHETRLQLIAVNLPGHVPRPKGSSYRFGLIARSCDAKQRATT